MEKEIARRALFRRLGPKAQLAILCAHATLDPVKDFTRDPVFPDAIGTNKLDRVLAVGLARIENAPPDNVPPSKILVRKQKSRFVLVYDGKHQVRVTKVLRDRCRSIYSGNEFDRDLWKAVYRYETLGMFSGMSASVLPSVYEGLRAAEPRATECFAAFFNHTCPGGYYGLFPDVEKCFGCMGSFFAIRKPPPLMLCNPPFQTCVVNAFVHRVQDLLARKKCEALVVLPAFDVNDRKLLNAECRDKQPVDYKTDMFYDRLRKSDHTRWHGMYCKDRFPYIDIPSGKVIHYTSTVVMYLSSYKTARHLTAVKKLLPEPNLE